MRIVYMGTPEFAVESLKALVEGGYNVVGVVTMPDKPMGRHGSVLRPSPVKEYALEHNLNILQPDNLKDPVFLDQLRALKADLQIVVAFRMLPEAVWNMPPMGTFNLHASLLPQYRGAAPINWAVMNGDKETGITTFFLKHEIDTGDIISQERIPIHEDDNVEIIHDKLMYLGSRLVVRTVDELIKGGVRAIPQSQLSNPGEQLRPAPKIFKETCEIEWERGLEKVYNHIRGLSPYPAAWTMLATPEKRQKLKIYETMKEESQHNCPTGTVLTDLKDYFKIALPGGYLHVTQLQLAGKRRMDVKEFLCGWRDKDARVE